MAPSLWRGFFMSACTASLDDSSRLNQPRRFCFTMELQNHRRRPSWAAGKESVMIAKPPYAPRLFRGVECSRSAAANTGVASDATYVRSLDSPCESSCPRDPDPIVGHSLQTAYAAPRKQENSLQKTRLRGGGNELGEGQGRGLRTFSWRQSRSHSLALTVLYRTHPTE